MCSIDSDACKSAVRVCFYNLSNEKDSLTRERIYGALAGLICTLHMSHCRTSNWREISRIVMKSARSVLEEDDLRITVIRNAMKGCNMPSDV